MISADFSAVLPEVLLAVFAMAALIGAVYTGKDLSREEEQQLRKYADRIILKTERSSERLLNEANRYRGRPPWSSQTARTPDPVPPH